MDSEKHALGVGKILCHLLNLELVLRFCIGIKTERSTVIPKVETLKKEKVHKRTAIIDCNYLPKVIEKFNTVFMDLNESVDKNKIVHLRNAIVHGKICSEEEPFPSPMTIFNIGKINGDQDHVKIEFIEEMTEDWFISSIEFLNNETLRIYRFYNKIKNEFLKSLREVK